MNDIVKTIYEQVKKFYAEKQRDKSLTHDLDHTLRVYNMAMRLYKSEKQTQPENLSENSETIIGAAALLHDVDDPKVTGNMDGTIPNAAAILYLAGIPSKEITDKIKSIIQTMSFHTKQPVAGGLEGQIVQDADRLDAMGAIGIARAFQYGGANQKPIYVPQDDTPDTFDINEYYGNNRSSISHFHEKLTKLYGMLNTKTAKLIGRAKHEYMIGFLNTFAQEIKMAQNEETETE